MRPEALILPVLLGACFPAGGTAAWAAETPALTALVVRTAGTVTGEAPAGGLVPLARYRVVPGDLELSVPAGGRLELLCSSDRAVHLDGPVSGHPVAAACEAGHPLLPGTYRATTTAGRTLAVEHSAATRRRVLQLKSRGSEEDDPRVPILLAPRETAVRRARPDIRWTRVPGAREYVVELVGSEPWTVRLEAEDVPCAPQEHPPATLDVCTVPWPAEAPELPPGEAVYLAVGARTGIVTPLRSAAPRRVRLLPADAIREVDATRDALRGLELPPGGIGGPAGGELAEALLLARAGLRGEAAEVVRSALAARPSADAFLLQGALQLDAHLPRAARSSFLEAACRAEAPESIHEAARGLETALGMLGATG